METISELNNIENENKGTILVIDDEPALGKFLQSALERINYKILVAIDWDSGLEDFDKNNESIDLVILDLNMPNKSWKEVLEELLEVKSSVKVILTSGVREEDYLEWVSTKIKWFIKKPFSLKDLYETVDLAITR